MDGSGAYTVGADAKPHEAGAADLRSAERRRGVGARSSLFVIANQETMELPSILCGPILRRCDEQLTTVWLATSYELPAKAALRIEDASGRQPSRFRRAPRSGTCASGRSSTSTCCSRAPSPGRFRAASFSRTRSGSVPRSTSPVHDWASHASDALRTLAEADLAGRLVSAGCRRIPDRPMCHRESQSEP
jgi:hypothetical protein